MKRTTYGVGLPRQRDWAYYLLMTLAVVIAFTLVGGATFAWLEEKRTAHCWVYDRGEKEYFDYSRSGCEKD